jgi:hypothetical protein
MSDNIEINIKEIPVIVIDTNEDAEQEYLELDSDDEEYFFDQNNMHYIWKPVFENWGVTRTTRYEATEYWLKTPEGIVKKRLEFARTM